MSEEGCVDSIAVVLGCHRIHLVLIALSACLWDESNKGQKSAYPYEAV